MSDDKKDMTMEERKEGAEILGNILGGLMEKAAELQTDSTFEGIKQEILDSVLKEQKEYFTAFREKLNADLDALEYKLFTDESK